jgi:hypothetical protein
MPSDRGRVPVRSAWETADGCDKSGVSEASHVLRTGTVRGPVHGEGTRKPKVKIRATIETEMFLTLKSEPVTIHAISGKPDASLENQYRYEKERHLL